MKEHKKIRMSYFIILFTAYTMSYKMSTMLFIYKEC